MKCLKVDEFIRRTASVEDAKELHRELEDFVMSGPGALGRTICDRIVRACLSHLGAGSPSVDHINQLLNLVEVSMSGYYVSAAHAHQSSPLYMEKIIFHIIKSLSLLDVSRLCTRVALQLYDRLVQIEESEEYFVLVRSCFTVMWSSLCCAKNGKLMNPQEKLHCQMQALSFLILQDKEGTTSSSSRVPKYAEDSISEFESNCDSVSAEDASFVLLEMSALFDRCQNIHQGTLFTLFETTLVVVKMCSKAGHYDLAVKFLSETVNKVGGFGDRRCAALVLGKWAVKICSKKKAEKEIDEVLAKSVWTLKALSAELQQQEANAVLAGCAFVMWAVENGHRKALSGASLLSLFSFLEQLQDLLLKMLKKTPSCESAARLQHSLCVSLHQGFVFTYGSMQAAQLEDKDTMSRVLLYCQSIVGLMMNELRKLPSDGFLVRAVVSVSNIVCGLFNQRLYDQAFTLVEILCRDLIKNGTASLSVDRLNRPFMLAVQSSRRAGHLMRALDWVVLWLKALGDQMTGHMAEPVSLWVKIKTDAAKSSDEDVRLRTLCDGFGPGALDEMVMLKLLDEELRGYKELAADTSQERYNTLCDLLEICHEESSHTHLRAVYLCEMAQVVCYLDFSAQTDCTAVDFTHEALRLLEEEPVTPANEARLKDDKAHALFWLYICTLEKNIQEATERDKQMQEMREKTSSVANTISTNDFEHEDKQKSHSCLEIYEGLHFSLADDQKMNKPLEQALNEWSGLLRGDVLSAVRSPEQTCSSVLVTAALFKLMAKPLKALEAFQLAIGLSRRLEDVKMCVRACCQSACLLLDMGSPQLAKFQLEQAEGLLSSKTAEDLSSLCMLVVLLKSQFCYSVGQMDAGVNYLCEVLQEVGKQRQSRSWYLLRAQALQTCSAYISLNTATLPQHQRHRITQHGMSSPDTALYESQKLLCSLLVTLVGNSLYGNLSGGSEVRFVCQGDNLMVKWELLSQLLNGSMKMVVLRSSSGALNDARLHCLEALKLAKKLQAFIKCAELLVVKAELELLLGEKEESRLDLEKVRSLLEFSADTSEQQKKPEIKIKPRKGRPAQRAHSPLPTVEDECKSVLSTRWNSDEPIVRDLSCSPPLKTKPRCFLSSLKHKPDCQCSCCSQPSLAWATARWAAAQADLVFQLDPSEAKLSLKLYLASLLRFKTATVNLERKLDQIFTQKALSKGSTVMLDVIGSVYLRMALSGMEARHSKVFDVWGVLRDGLEFVDSSPCPSLGAVKASLTAVKACASLGTLADKENCSPEELFSNSWTWNAPKESLTQASHILNKAARSAKKPKGNGTSTSGKVVMLAPKTPAMARNKARAKELDCFDFNTSVPTFAFTPVRKVGAPSSVKKAPRTGGKQFHVFEEEDSPQKALPVPAAPRRTKKCIFKVDFSDESDSEVTAEPKEPPKKGTTTRKGRKEKEDPHVAIAPPKRTTRRTKSTAAAVGPSSDEDEKLVCPPSTARRGRPRKDLSRKGSVEEPDKMRAIEEKSQEVLDVSIDQLVTSDTEDGSVKANDVDVEVLRRDMACNHLRDDVFELQTKKLPGLQPPVQHPAPWPDNLSLEDVESLLRSAWLATHHFPSPAVYSTLCSLLALSSGQKDCLSTAMFHCQSLGLTSRHRTIRHLASCLKKLKKASGDIAHKLDSLTLDDKSSFHTEERLKQLEGVFSFSTSAPASLLEDAREEFRQQIEQLPQGVTVCVMSVLGLRSGQMGESILLSRLEKGCPPVSVLIPTSSEQHSIRWLVQEMDSIQVEQKAVSCVSEKAKWWEGRQALDSRVERLLREMESLLHCWRCLLLPLSTDPEISTKAQNLVKTLHSEGVTVSEQMLKALISASPVLSKKDLQRFALGISSKSSCLQALLGGLLADREQPEGHVVLILDKYLQKLPWESISVLKSHSVSRMPSLQSLIGLSLQKETDPKSILKEGVDKRKVFYVLDPDANLTDSQDRFKEWFGSEKDWEGVCGSPPHPGQLEVAVSKKDLYIYVGHGAGARFLDSNAVLQQQVRAASLLFGCSSAALAVKGNAEGHGIVINYLMAGCPLVLGMLWDVTDRDADRFTKALLDSWFAGGRGSSLLQHMGPSRDVTRLKHLMGAAPIVYGLPIHLK
ncbi:separin [Neosynchiropus ocellatus]